MLRSSSVSQRSHNRLTRSKSARAAALAPRGRVVVAALALSASASAGIAAESLAQPADTALERRAAAYVAFREDVATVEATPFNSASTTREAHKRLATHDSKALSAGWVAYAALVAADTPEFVEGLQAELSAAPKKGKKVKGAAALKGRDAFFAKLAEDPTYAGKVAGADLALQRVLSMTAQDAARFSALGESFKQQAYAMQRTAWGKSKIPAGAQRNAEAAQFGAARPAKPMPASQAVTSDGVTAPMLNSLDGAWAPGWGASAPAPRDIEPNARVVLDRVLNLAARYAVGGANEKLVDAYAKNDRADQCLYIATLTLRQCIAATRAPYEEAFCLGEHALNDVSGCVGWVAQSGDSSRGS